MFSVLSKVYPKNKKPSSTYNSKNLTQGTDNMEDERSEKLERHRESTTPVTLPSVNQRREGNGTRDRSPRSASESWGHAEGTGTVREAAHAEREEKYSAGFSVLPARLSPVRVSSNWN